MPIRSIKYLNQSKKKWLQTQLETEKSQTLSEKNDNSNKAAEK